MNIQIFVTYLDDLSGHGVLITHGSVYYGLILVKNLEWKMK